MELLVLRKELGRQGLSVSALCLVLTELYCTDDVRKAHRVGGREVLQDWAGSVSQALWGTWRYRSQDSGSGIGTQTRSSHSGPSKQVD